LTGVVDDPSKAACRAGAGGTLAKNGIAMVIEL
jgi:hypothetical protein